MLRQTKFAAQQSLRRRGAQTNNDPRSDIKAISASSQGRQAAISSARGFW